MHTDTILAWVLALALIMLGVGYGIGSDWEGGKGFAVIISGLFFVAIAVGIHTGISNARYEQEKKDAKK